MLSPASRQLFTLLLPSILFPAHFLPLLPHFFLVNSCLSILMQLKYCVWAAGLTLSRQGESFLLNACISLPLISCWLDCFPLSGQRLHCCTLCARAWHIVGTPSVLLESANFLPGSLLGTGCFWPSKCLLPESLSQSTTDNVASQLKSLCYWHRGDQGRMWNAPKLAGGMHRFLPCVLGALYTGLHCGAHPISLGFSVLYFLWPDPEFSVGYCCWAQGLELSGC